VVLESDEGLDGPWRGIMLHRTSNALNTIDHLHVRHAGHFAPSPCGAWVLSALAAGLCSSSTDRANMRFTVRDSIFDGASSYVRAADLTQPNADLCTANTFLNGAECLP